MTALLSNKHHATPRMRHHNQAECTMDTTNVSGMNFEAPVTTTELSEAELAKATGGGGGSCSGGCGTGKVTFNPFSITRKIDSSSPILF
jgi:heterodisulfide reductase subunit A-like polyferredoxin